MVLHECSCFIEFIERVWKKRKREVCRAFPLFRNRLNKFNNTSARLLDSIYMYHMSFNVTLKSHFCRKTLLCFRYVRNVVMDAITFPENL